MMKEFRAFAVKGNMIDMAVGIVIGAAFGKIVSTFVGQVVMPLLGLLIGGVDFSELAITLKEATDQTEAVVIGYGAFIQTAVDFAIIAFAVFLVIKWINALKRKEAAPAEAAAPPQDIALLTEIRDLLKQQR